ncbi:MAG: xanthine dehydrogenase family protein molybdopterin-binding subunit [Nocardiopsaceae bacterium]|nr:xanthine dehydrogenase family protein molybdopterin-binding subunit [Nocardiopsaceae bacterium]
MSILGTRVRRTEDPGFLTKGGVYTEDVQDERLNGAAHVHFVRSTVAHARIRGIDASAAKEADGVIAVYTGQDLADDGVTPIKALMPVFNQAMVQPWLASGKVRYVGEPVAAVVTEHPYQGEDAIELVDVDYDILPAVVDPAAAKEAGTEAGQEAAKEAGQEPEAGLLFPDAGTNIAVTFGDETELDEHLFDGCEVVVSETIVNQRVAPAPMETRAAAAIWDGDRVTAWIPNQGAQGTRSALASVLGVKPGQVRIITPEVGGGFGAKFGVDPEHAVVAWVAKRLNRPARWTETRTENLLAMTHGRAQRQKITIGGSAGGDISAYRLEILQDVGAYQKMGTFLPSLTILMTPGPYDIPRAEAIATSVVTNTTPIGAYRGAGRPEATAAIERAVDLFAAETGVDPAEVRRKNLLPTFDKPHETAFGAVYDTGDYVAALEKALVAADYTGLREEQRQRRQAGDPVALGIGLSSYVEITGGGAEAGGPNENATVEVHPDGTATILTGTSPHGQGHQTVWAMLASEELGIPMDKITVRWGDTDLVPSGGGTGGSRSLQLGGAAVQKASRDLLDIARERAASELEVSQADLEFDVSRSGFNVKGDPDAHVPLPELARDERLFVNSVFAQPGATFPFGTQVAVVEVDTETGKVTLRRVVAADDAGTVINPLLAEGQRHGGIAQGAAQAFVEEVVYDDDGNPLTSTFADYPFVTATELPSFELVDSQTPTPYNPLGAKGIGEAGTIGSTPAVQNAVVDAVAHLGVRHIDLPASPQRVWRAINAASPVKKEA